MRKHRFYSRITFLLVVLGCILGLAQASFAQNTELKPNLKAFPAYAIIILDSKLRFSTLTWNNGQGPLELVAGETGQPGQNVYQRVYLSDGSYYDRHAGTFEWHPQHAHFHFGDYALYTLQPVDAPGGSQRIGSKTTFCVMDTYQIDDSLAASPDQAVYVTCDNDFQGMSVGYGDEYGWYLAGQEIDVSGLPNGDYRLTIVVDPKDRLVEMNETDNTACVLLNLNFNNRKVQILDDSSCDNDTGGGSGGTISVDSLDPDTVSKGSVNLVKVYGSGFEPGMAVSFENGKGPSPSANNVNVISETLIEVTVTAPIKGKKETQSWDVRVGSAVRTDGLTVVP